VKLGMGGRRGGCGWVAGGGRIRFGRARGLEVLFLKSIGDTSTHSQRSRRGAERYGRFTQRFVADQW